MPHVELAAVLAEEFRELHGPPHIPIATEADYARAAHRKRIAALCLSGGGIRSASFALGVLQSLARHGLLTRFHYLSTVSGGGYIGSWLQAWRRHAGALAPVIQGLNARDPASGREPEELTGLRENSAYLTPRLGVTSADTWAVVTLYVRNFVLNWAVLGPVFLAGLTVPWLAYDLMASVAHWGGDGLFWALVGLGFLALVAGLHSAAWQRRRPGSGIGQPGFLGWVFAPVYTAGMFLALAAATKRDLGLGLAAALGAGAYLLAWGSAWLRSVDRRLGRWPTIADPVPPWLEGLIWVASGALAGVLVLLSFRAGIGSSHDLRGIVAVGMSGFMLSILVPEIVYVGLASYANSGDHDREWLARAAGWLLAGAVGWLLLSGIVLFAGDIVGLAGGVLALLVGLLSGGATASAGASAKTGASLALNATSRLVSSAKGSLLSIGALIFVLALAVAMSVLDASLLTLLSSTPREFYVPSGRSFVQFGWDLGLLVFLAAFAAFASFVVNVNRFSLHALYRNRLVRAFLGAARRRAYGARPARKPNLFTGFDQNDNVPLTELWKADYTEQDRRLFPVLNIALNLVSGSNPAWQERKAESFTATPLHCGGHEVGYRPTREYGGMRTGLSLGTAMAISGAAVSPNMGYHSSPLIGFVMTLFNVRLGWWLGNPRREDRTARSDGPYFGAVAVLRELFGLTTDRSAYVYLSDGGHFENLGVYEMVRRRCRFILVSDAGQDPKAHFEDLGNAVRKIWIDFGVRIEFTDLRIEARADPAQRGVDVAVARIRYRDAYARPGVLVYIKPGFHGEEAPDIRSYANLHPEFPHETTLNQWFTESQMEAYRALGAETMDAICRGGQPATRDSGTEQLTLAGFWTRARGAAAGGKPEDGEA